MKSRTSARAVPQSRGKSCFLTLIKGLRHIRGLKQTTDSIKMDLWEIADTVESLDSPNDTESTVFFVGSSKSGKSTIIQNFLKPNSKKEPKPTFSLEYNFARKKLTNGKALAHIWEMGGDINESKLLNVPVSPKTIESITAVVCVDLSKPQNIVSHTRHWIRQLRSSIEVSFSQLRAERNDKLQEMVRASKAPFVEHVDNGRVKPSPIPLIVMGTKYDTLRANGVSTAERRLLFQALRFVAHYYGGTVMCSGGDGANLRGMLATVCFQGTKALKPMRETSADKMNFITVGQDSYDAILGSEAPNGVDDNAPPSPNKAGRLPGVLEEGSTSAPNEQSWKALAQLVEDAFGPAEARLDAAAAGEAGGFDGGNTDGGTASGGGNNGNEYPEPEIDEEREKRRVILERYVAEEERKEALVKKMERKETRTSAPHAAEAVEKGAGRMRERDSKDVLGEDEKSYRK